MKTVFDQPSSGQHSANPKLRSSLCAEGIRHVQPEILDGLHQHSPEALASRRDIRIINQLLGSHDWFKKVLAKRFQPGDRILEIGAGDGRLGRVLASTGAEFAGLDLARRPRDWAHCAEWFETDVLKFAGWADFSVVIANLFFHHFHSEQLRQIGARLGQTRLVIASEPLRAPRTACVFSLVCPVIGAHPVTRHDGRVSIAAGFRNDELPKLLGLDPAIWQWQVHETWRGASQLVAERRS